MKNTFRFPFFMLLILTGCATPYPIVRLQTQEKDTEWFWGNEYVHQQQDSIKMSLAFDGTEGTNLVFDAEISNQTSRSILIAPELFLMKVKQELVVTPHAKPKSFYFEQKAADPEQMILSLDKDVSREEAAYTNEQDLQLTTTLLQIAGEVATIKQPNTQEEVIQNNEYWRDNSIINANNESSYLLRNAYLNQRKLNWKTDVIRKTTLRAGESIRGRIIFPTNQPQRLVNRKTDVTLVFPIDGILLYYNYHQTTHIP